MKKNVFILMILSTIVGCKNANKVWLLELGQSKTDVEKILSDDNYRYEYKTEDELIGNQVVEYLGMKWDGFMLYFKNDRLQLISFQKADGEEITESDAQDVVERIDKMYGEHREDRTASRQFGSQAWEWNKHDIIVKFARLFGGTMGTLYYRMSINGLEPTNNKKVEVHEQEDIVEQTVDD